MLTYSRQKGLSLIELMVAMALGIVMMGASLQFLVTTTQTYDLTDDISRVQENGRIALDLMAKDVMRAGQNVSLISAYEDTFLMDCTVAAACLCDDSQAGCAADQMAVRYIPFTTGFDCAGNAIPANISLVNVYTVADLDGNGVNSLYCGGFNATTNTWINPATPQQPLVDGIDQIQVLYRVTTPATSPSARDTYRYVSADQLATADLEYITAARIGLLVNNGRLNGSADLQNRSYTVLDGAQVSFNDTHMRRIYTTTVQFNNAN